MKKKYATLLFANALIITGILIAFSARAQFIAKWRTTIKNEVITIRTTGSGYNYSVDWGDGNTSSKLVSVYGWTIEGDSLSCVLPPEPKVFPNPTTGLVTISNTQSGDVILLTDAIGQKLLTQLATGATQTLNINFVAQGDYFISIFRKDKIVVTKKISKLN